MNIKAANGCFVCAEQGGGIHSSEAIALRANRTVAGPWEEFNLINNIDGSISLQTVNGNYITAELNGTLSTAAVAIGEWEKFHIEGLAFRSYRGTYITAELMMIDVPLVNEATSIGPWEEFTYHVDPINQMSFAGNFCGLYVPELVKFIDNNDPSAIHTNADNGGYANGLANGLFFTPAYRVYSDSGIRSLLRQRYKQAFGTHFPISLFDDNTRWYHSCYPPVRVDIVTALEELRNDGFSPAGFACNDNSNEPAIVPESLVCHIIPGWERNEDAVKENVQQLYLSTRYAYPNTPMWTHFTSNHGGGWVPEADSWHWFKSIGVVGNLFQTELWRQGLNNTIARIDDYLIRFGSGYHGWPTGISFQLFESMAYACFWNGTSTEECNQKNSDVLNVRGVGGSRPTLTEGGITYTGSLIEGYCNGKVANDKGIT